MGFQRRGRPSQLRAALLVLPALISLAAAACGPRATVARLVTPTPAPVAREATPEPPAATPTPRATEIPRVASSPAPSATPPPAATAPPTAAPRSPTEPPQRAAAPTAVAAATAVPTAVPTTAPAEKPGAPAASVPSVGMPVATPTPLSAAAVNLPGQWRFRAETGERPIVGTLRFWFEDSRLNGTYTGLRGNTTTLTNVRVTGILIAFDLVAARGTWHLDGAVAGSSMTGTFQTASRTIRWTAAKEEGTAEPP